MRAAVAMLVFNRPETTARVLDAVRAARPRRLLVVADGPRPGVTGEGERCAAVRSLFNRIDWECEVERNYSTVNMGCRKRIASGLDWVFERAEEAIIVEDDCLPTPTFFSFCDALLERYRDDLEVMAITGDNFQAGRRRGHASYYFSRLMHVWGWASWRRAWQRYDVSMGDWSELRGTGWLEGIVGSGAPARRWSLLFDGTHDFDRTHDPNFDTWDYQWMFAVWSRRGVVATPNVNLVSNIGAGQQATHTKGRTSFLGLPTEPMAFPLAHPPSTLPDEAADRFVQRTMFTPTLLDRVGGLVGRLLQR